MKAAQIKKFGSPDVIELVDIEKPSPGKGQVLVKVYASSVNPFDVKLSQGMMPNFKLPMILGGDIAGVVTEIGEAGHNSAPGSSVENFSVGNKVYGSANVLSGASGAFAEFAAVPVGNLAKMPKNLDFKEAAAVVLTGVSAVQAITEYFNLQPGHPPSHEASARQRKILIHGGAGGIGTIAIQIAKSIGAHVATTTTGDGIEYVKKLGADEVIDYKTQDFSEILSDYDCVFDTVGGEVYKKSFKVLKKPARNAFGIADAGGGGVIVSMLDKDEKLAEEYGVTAIGQFTKVNTENLNKLTYFLEEKHVKAHIDKVYDFDKIREAFKEKETSDVMGKIVIEINH